MDKSVLIFIVPFELVIAALAAWAIIAKLDLKWWFRRVTGEWPVTDKQMRKRQQTNKVMPVLDCYARKLYLHDIAERVFREVIKVQDTDLIPSDVAE